MAKPTRRLAVVIALALTLAAGAVRADSPNDFYLNVLHRGVSYADAGSDLAAAKELRIAAFGLVEDIEQFEIAEAYLAVVAHRLKREEEARHSLQRLVAAERVERHYPSLPLPKEIRSVVETIAPLLLTSEQVAVLRDTRVPVPTPSKPQPVTPQPVRPSPTPATPTPQPVTPVPQPIKPTPQPIKPAPQPTPPAPQPVTPAPQPIRPAPQPIAPAPQPVEPVPEPIRPAPQPTTPAPQPLVPAPRSVTPVPRPAMPVTNAGDPASISNGGQHTLPPANAAAVPADVRSGLAAADQALDRGDLAGARERYGRLVAANLLDRASALRVAEGLYQTGDYRNAVRAYQRASGFREGESRQEYYYALSLYESGEYRAAKRELALALPKLDRTPDLERNRAKIEGAVDER